MVIDPEGMNAQEWTDAMALELARFGSVPKLDRVELWRDWAIAVQQFTEIAVTAPPDPYQFSDWKDWAMRFNEVYELVS